MWNSFEYYFSVFCATCHHQVQVLFIIDLCIRQELNCSNIHFCINKLSSILPFRCPPEFVFLYREFGGDLSLRDDQGRLATDIAENAPSLKTLRTLQGMIHW